MFEKIGMPALVVQIITGPILAYRFLPDIGQWFNMDNPLAHPIAAKLILLALTAGVAFHAKLRVIPVLSKDNLGAMAWHVIAVTRSEEHTSELQSLMRISYAVFCLKKQKTTQIC